MVDLVYGRGITDIVREFPFYITFFRNIIDIRLFHKKTINRFMDSYSSNGDISLYAKTELIFTICMIIVNSVKSRIILR